MPEKNIPQINQDLDIKLLLHVLSKNLVWILFLFVLAIISAFLLIRYTKPIYQAKSVIQLTSGDPETKNVLDEKLNPYNTGNLAKEIELLRSPVFLQRVVKRLPVDVSYYSKGAILNFETYKSTPFVVVYDSVESSLYGVKFNIKIEDAQKFIISSEDTRLDERAVHFNEWVELGKTRFKLVPKGQVNDYNERYIFTFNNPQHLVGELSSYLQVKALSESAKTIEISYAGFNPVKVADVVNGIAKEFEYFNIEKKQEKASRVLAYIDRTLGIISTNLGENERELSGYFSGDRTDPYLLQLERGSDFSKISKLDEQRLKIESDLNVLQQVKRLEVNNRNDVMNIYVITTGSGIQSSLSGLLDRFSQLFNSYEEINYSSPEGSPMMSKVKYQIEQQKKTYAMSLVSLENVLQDKLVQIDENAKKIELEKKISLTDTTNINASILKRTKEVNEKFFNQLIQKKAEYAIAKEGFTPEYQILEFASVPESPIAPNKQMIILSAIGSWLLLSLLLVGVRYLLNDQILLVRDISKYTDAPILGMIHKYKEDIPVSQLVVDKKPKGLIAEAFRTVRTNLQFIHNEPGPKVISLTSTISGEGKTFVSINLAGILAFSGHKVIVIDCDMRKPKIHMGFEVDNDFGMSTILIGKNTLEECIRKSQMANLDFITAGPIPPNPAELLLMRKMDETVEELKSKYDFIVIDNPPSGLVSDAIVNLQRADYPIYVFRSDYSRKFFINNLLRLKDENKITNISCVLNSVDLQKNKSYGYGYGYGSYNYGYGYGYGFGYYEEETGNRKGSKLYNIIRGKKN